MFSNLELNNEQKERFCVFAREKNDLIMRALIRLNIPKRQYREMYGFGLEGLLVSFLMLEEGVIESVNFDRFAFNTIKRKLIDELRRRNKTREIAVDFLENTSLHSDDTDAAILMIEFKDYLNEILTEEELTFANVLLITSDVKKAARELNISLATAYRLHKKLKVVCRDFFNSK